MRFTENGLARACSIFGWIAGIAIAATDDRKAFAAKAAKDICEQFDWLACYGGHHVDPGFTNSGKSCVAHAQRYIVELSDDGTFGGFSVLWLAAVHPTVHEASSENSRWVEKYDKENRYNGGPQYRYTRSMNGGLLFHGPGGGEVFAVQLGLHRLWSIHT